MRSIVAELERTPQPNHYLRLHFFQEYDVPLDLMSQIQEHGSEYMLRDRAESKACNSSSEVRKRDGSGNTIVKGDI